MAGLENPFLGLVPKGPAAPETLGFGYLLFEMTLGYELPGPPSPAHLQLELDRAPKVADALELIFQNTRSVFYNLSKKFLLKTFFSCTG